MNWLGKLIQQEVDESDTVLDLGCGKGQAINGLKCKMLTGIDIFKEWLEEYSGKKILADVTKVKFKSKSFDVILALDILEHVFYDETMKLIKKMERWARKKVIIYTPSKFESQNDLGNPYNKHLCFIPAKWFKDNDYTVSFPEPDKNTLAIKVIKNV